MNILQVCAPSSESEDNEMEEFYGEIERLLRNIKDLNVKIGKRKCDDLIEEHILGE